MNSPQPEGDSELEELLSQLEDESLLELKLDSFRRGSVSFVTEGQSDTTSALSTDLEKRYENLKAQSFASGAHVAEVGDNNKSTVLHTDKEEPKWSPHDLGCEAQCVDSFREDSAAMNGVKGETEAPLKSSTEPLLKPKTQQEAPAKKESRENSPSPSPPARRSCFCFSSRGSKSKQRTGKRWAASKGGGSGGRGQGKARASDRVEEDEEWAGVLEELEGMEEEREEEKEVIDVSLFDVQKNERELKRVSKKERQLTDEAQKFVNWVATSSSARFTMSPDHAENLSSKHS